MTSARETEPSGASGWKDVLPIVRLFGKSRGESLRGDVIGGISACVVMIPSVIAYADLAGLPPAHGLYAALAAMLGYAAFASAKHGLRAVAQTMARELGPKNIHVAHLIIDSGVDTAWVRERREQMWGKEALDNPDLLMPPASVASAYWQLYQQPKSAWTFEMEIRPFGEKW